MYALNMSEAVSLEIKAAAQISPSILSRLEELEQNPFHKAKQTGIPFMGQYYVNAGRYCLLFDIVGDDINFKGVIKDSYLYNIIHRDAPIPSKFGLE